MLLNSSHVVSPPNLHKKESRYEREQRIKVGSITGYDPRKETATRRLLLEDSSYLENGPHYSGHDGGLSWERAEESRHGYPSEAGGTPSERMRHASGCNITRYSGQHSYSPLSASLSELNLAKCKTPTPISIYNQREDHFSGSYGGDNGVTGSLPGPKGLDKFMEGAKFQFYARNKEFEDANGGAESNSRVGNVEENDGRRELMILKDVESRKHNYKDLPPNRSPIELDRYEDFPVDPPCSSLSPFERFSATALYDFKVENPRELEFSKGDILSVHRKVDSNWYEGELRGLSGIFPISYVSSPSRKRGTVSSLEKRSFCSSNKDEGRTLLAKFDYKAQSPLELSLKKGDVICIQRVVDKNWTEGSIGSLRGIFPSSYARPLGESLKRGSPSTHSRLKELPEPPPLAKAFERENPFIKDSQNNNDEALYRALFNYKPQNEDEVELLEGDMISVLEKCDDGWFVGTSQRTGAFGTFPGNYVVHI